MYRMWMGVCLMGLLLGGCSSNAFHGACYGEPIPGGVLATCADVYPRGSSPSSCNAHPGCTWRGTFCDGTPARCGSQRELGTCSALSGCVWLEPPTCESVEDCAIQWLRSGGCEEVRRNTPELLGYGDPSAPDFVSIATYCP